MSQITTHILDVSRGSPASGIKVELSKIDAEGVTLVAEGVTDNSGRIGDFLNKDQILDAGEYQLTFETEGFYTDLSQDPFYREVNVVFRITADGQHYHLPLLLSPFGYTTYRGS